MPTITIPTSTASDLAASATGTIANFNSIVILIGGILLALLAIGAIIDMLKHKG